MFSPQMTNDDVARKTLDDKLSDYDRILTLVDKLLQIHEALKGIDKVWYTRGPKGYRQGMV